MKRVTALPLALACLLATVAPAGAETLRVTSSAEDGPGSLGQKILEAGPGDVIVLPPGSYPLTNGDTLIEQGNTLRGAGVEATTIVPTGGGEALVDDAVTVEDARVADALQPSDEEGSGIERKAQIVALIATLAIFLVVLELVRRRRLVERYALLWMGAAVALLVLSIWTDLLGEIADAMGIQEPANAIFILAFGVVFVLLLHFSVATSRLGEETKILAQEAARLDLELRVARGEAPGSNGAGSAAPSAEQDEHDPPIATQRDG